MRPVASQGRERDRSIQRLELLESETLDSNP